MENKKLHVALLFGGNSSEHDVSKLSARNIYEALDRQKYEVSVFMFTKQGYLLDNQASLEILEGGDEATIVEKVMQDVDFTNPLANLQNLSQVKDVDLFMPVIHGNMGEDGTIQGLFRLLDKPWVGSGIAASANSFDKDLTKQLLTYNGIRNTKYITIKPENRADYTYEKVVAELGTDLFIKPARQGSSIGIHPARNEAEFIAAVEDAFKYDYKVVVEQAVKNVREVECAVIGNRDAKASQLGAIAVQDKGEFYDYNNKFVDASGVVFELPANLPSELTQEIREMAVAAYHVLDNKGLSRIDFLIDEDNVPYLGEINTLPGFTNISLYPQLWELEGISYAETLDRLINLALEEYDYNAKLSFDLVLDND
ncbi:D-alanine--D-alanine ligase family protein [Ligilactobacillus ceti]|uniref:D-alanine--D-alanine ligase n=1 Tax=Ligilactobacillus ceti DSM 22408 TaxID=1122146 RepID=A0A0R2KQ03_9LACO|nr:D-alanine--D-alanine ligase family protein [Ligilactobacillus ceti]KRN88988.1 D-ala D-ala ligase N-terminal domain protein [Ligilactobacillus ceti DSM 22408]